MNRLLGESIFGDSTPNVRKGFYANFHFALWGLDVHMLVDGFGRESIFGGIEFWGGDIDDLEKLGCDSFVVGDFEITHDAVAVHEYFGFFLPYEPPFLP